MKKIITLQLFFVFLAITAIAQTPMFFNTNAAGGQNSIPFNSGAQMVWRRAQFCMPANSLGSVGPGNNITTVYFQAGSNANVTYPTFTVRLKTASAAGMQGVGSGPFEAGMTQVFQATNFNMVTTSGNWYGITLQTPFLYDPSFPLIVDFEHDHPAAVGPTVMQPGAITLSGSNGRQWGNNNGAPISGTGTNQFNFGIDVIAATPCTAAPIANTISPSSFTTCPFLTNPTMSLASTYSFGGITYQWQSSTVSPVGPFSAIPGATMAFAPSGTINTTTWFQVVATCTNPGGGATTITPTQFFVAGGVTSTVPYFENFEGIQTNNRLPNCSWYAPNIGSNSSVNTYMASASNNRVALSGTKFGTFTFPSNSNPVYSNGITMSPGITYSAAINYATEYFGYSNWTNLSILVGNAQTPGAMNLIASVSPAISGPYKVLGGTFTVPSQGDYFICIRATGSSGGATYLMWDDLSVTIPCSGAGAVNSPTLLTSVNSNTICAGDPLTINVSGADDYLWSNGGTGALGNYAPTSSTIITVAGTNTLTGCVSNATEYIVVNPAPSVVAFASKTDICPGENSYLSAVGADSFAWSNGSNGNVVTVSPNASTTYTVIGSNAFGCSNSATISVAVKTLPTVLVNQTSSDICAGENAVLNASGGSNYQWYSSASNVLYQGSQISVPLTSTATFTVKGTGANGCSGLATITQNVSTCQGITQVKNADALLKVFPNPSAGIFNFQVTTGVINTIVITDLSGRQLLAKTGTTDNMQIDLNSLSAGIYYAAVMNENNTQVIRLVKE